MVDTLDKEGVLVEGPLGIGEVTVPEAVKTDLREGTTEIGDLILRENPGLIITLDRSGTLLWDNFSSPLLKSKGTDLPPVITSGIGRGISDRILEEMGTNEEEIFGNPDLQKKYLVFLSEDSGAQYQVHQLAEKLHKLNLTNIKSVLCVDDTRNQGMTLTFSAPFIISEALKEVGLGTGSLDDGEELIKGYDIQNYSQPPLELGSVGLFRQIISKNQWLGFIKNANFPNEKLRAIAQEAKVVLPVVEQNVYELLKGSKDLGGLEKYYSREDLLSLEDKLKRGLQKAAGGAPGEKSFF